MNAIAQTAFDYWHRAKVKTSPSGWLSRNAPCCHHRGEKADRRGRGGLKVDGDGTLSIHCFNCSYTCSYTPGRPLYPKFQKMLRWLGVDERQIGQLRLESLRLTRETDGEQAQPQRRAVKSIEMPDCELLETAGAEWQRHRDFLSARGFADSDFPFLVSSQLGMRNRVIMPFIYQDTIVGYSARSIIAQDPNRYIMRCTTDYVFGLGFAEPEHEWVVVTEGIFDALSIRGLAVLHNEISDAQAEMICDLNKRVIVVPDLDRAGLSDQPNSLINSALENGWSVSIPEWPVKDINEAYVKYGLLFCVQHILRQATDNPTSIRLQQKIRAAATRK